MVEEAGKRRRGRRRGERWSRELLGWSKSTAASGSCRGGLRRNSGGSGEIGKGECSRRISERRGGDGCEEMERGRSPFIGAASSGGSRAASSSGGGYRKREARASTRGGAGGHGGRQGGRGAADGGRGRRDASAHGGTGDGNLAVASSLQGTGARTGMSGRFLGVRGGFWRELTARRGRSRGDGARRPVRTAWQERHGHAVTGRFSASLRSGLALAASVR